MRDADVRASVLKMLAEQHSNDAATRIVEEMGIWAGSVRIDVAVINGELTGYEIKSDRDTLERLPAQERLYSRLFDRVVLVTGLKHVNEARRLIPAWWGMTVAKPIRGTIVLTPLRKPMLNRGTDPRLMAQLLWRDEALAVLEAVELAKGWRTRRVDEIHLRLATELKATELAERVRAVLKTRQGWLRQAVGN